MPGKQIKNGKVEKMKKILSLIIALVLVLSALSTVTVFAEEEDISITISVEGATIGQGFYVEPTVYTLSEINDLLAQKNYGPYTAETITAGMVTLAMFIDYGIDYDITGNWENTVYISAIKGIDKGTINIPPVIGEKGGPTNDNNTGNDDTDLGEFDYSFMACWMITVDHHMIGVGCGNYNAAQARAEGSTFGDGSVIRWQFTLWGYGLDLGVDNGWGMGGPYYTAANKCDIYRKYAELKQRGFFNTHPEAKAAALAVMENLTATQAQANGALSALEKAEEDEKLQNKQVEAVTAQIGALGNITLAKQDAVKKAREKYDALTDAQKALVKNADVLIAAEAKIKELKAELNNKPEDSGDEIMFVPAALLVLASCALVVRKKRKV